MGGVDYKGVREIMKNCIEKAQNLPTELETSLRPQVGQHRPQVGQHRPQVGQHVGQHKPQVGHRPQVDLR